MKAILCPGQGAQTPGYLQQLPDHQAVRLTLAEASQTLGRDIFLLDSAAALESTVAVQLTLVTASVAASMLAEGIGTNSPVPACGSPGGFPLS